MRVLGFSIPVIILLVGAYLIGVKFPAIGNKALGTVGAA